MIEALYKVKIAEERILKGDREYGATVQQLKDMSSVLESKDQQIQAMANDLASWKSRAEKAEDGMSGAAKVVSEMQTIQKELEAGQTARKLAEKKVYKTNYKFNSMATNDSA